MVRHAKPFRPVPNRVLDKYPRSSNTDSGTRDSRTLVVQIDDMDERTFVMHMNKRHPESLGGLRYIRLTCDPYVSRCWRLFHEQLHRWHIDLGHDHG